MRVFFRSSRWFTGREFAAPELSCPELSRREFAPAELSRRRSARHKFSRLAFACIISLAAPLAAPPPAPAQPANVLTIEWEVANRFRLFTDQEDFDWHVKAMSAAADGSVLAAEQWLETQPQFDGRGWADQVHPLCYDSFRGQIIASCRRDGRVENYLNPQDARIRLTAKLPAALADATCNWVVGTGDDAEKRTKKCSEAIDDVHASTKAPTPVAVTAQDQAGATLQAAISVQVRDVFIVGLGDSIASGEGNPDHPMRLDDEGFCFRRVLLGPGADFTRPGRANVAVDKSCDSAGSDAADRVEWYRAAAGWVFSSCHLSLYGYQMRTALALAVENPQISVTYVPMGCTGATIKEGLTGPKEARERPRRGSQLGGRYVEAQFDQLTNNYLASITSRRGQRRPIDLVLLTIGANDAGFAGLAANVIVEENPERRVLRKALVDPKAAKAILHGSLQADFRTLRARLRGIMGGTLDHVVYTSYGNPGMFDGGKTCGATRKGFDVHPAFAVDGARLAETVAFVDGDLFDTLKSYATCADSGCTQPAANAMVFVDSHQNAFRSHGVCASGDSDPAFDRDCFLDGNSFNERAQGLATPLRCTRDTGRVASEFRPYVRRERWVRTANDSYFTAMTYPDSNTLLGNPFSIHEANWGLESVVYGGALHPTAEGHAAMADAALAAARKVLGLPAPKVTAAGR